jgi:hypothetical protein
MLEPHSLKQRLLVLFKVLTSAKPPVINRQQSATCKIRNREKTLQSYQHKKITKYSYRRYPTAKRTDSKLKKARKNTDQPLHHFNRTVPATAEQEKIENPYSPAVYTTKVPKYTRTSPALHTAETHTRNIYRTRLARKIPTDPAHPIKETNYIDIHIPLTIITVNKRKRNILPLKCSIPIYDIKK